MKVLVTGAAGLLGQSLLERLQGRREVDLHGLDLHPVSLATPHTGDLGNPAWVAKLIADLQPDQVYHLAGTFSNEFQTDFAANVATTQHLLEAILQHHPTARLLTIGSAAEYGLVRQEENPIREDHPLAPVSLYGWAKVCQTHLVGYYHRVRGANVVQARLFNLSGRASPRLFVGRFYQQIDQVRRGEISEILTGPLGATRDYLSPTAAAEQLEVIMNRGRAGEVYHVASGIPINMRELVRQVLESEGLSGFPVREEARSTAGKLDIPWIHADIRKTKAIVDAPGKGVA
jgi:GDP-4-dehydro-6-deoxy-D-mannose reductase